MYLFPSEWPELRVLVLDIVLEAATPAVLSSWSGSAVRGSLLTALRQHVCTHSPNLTCPVCWLIAREDPQWRWGRTPARPYALAVPGEQGRPTGQRLHNSTAEWRRFAPGDPFQFRLTLFGEATHLLPYLVATLPCMGENGLGRRLDELGGRRGQFILRSIEAVHPLTQTRQPLVEAGRLVGDVSACLVSTQDVLALAAAWESQRAFTVFFDTPMRLIERRALCKTPRFRPLFQRALDRLEALMEQYGGKRPRWGDLLALFDLAERVRVADSETTWVELWSGSQRTQRITPLSGFVGQATFVADDWSPFVPLLAWMPIIQVGKDVVKGNGALRVSPANL